MVIATNANELGNGLGYVVAFGVGTTIGMSFITTLMSVPISIITKNHRVTTVQAICGLFSVLVGLFLLFETLVL